jgi:DnaD/phage-associated family protein
MNMNTNQEILKEMKEVEEMVKEAQEQEEYTEKYFVLREGMIRLAGGFVQAALLTSLLGWTRHWLKTDNEIYQEIKAAAEAGDIQKIRRLKSQIRQGWFWKSYREMSEELLGMVSVKTCQRYVEKFEEKGLISSKDPEEHTTYRAKWYKADIQKIKESLEEMGYQLDYYKNQTTNSGTCQNDKSQNTGVSETKSPNPLNSGTCQNDKSSGQNDKSSGQNDKHLLYTYYYSSSSTTSGRYVGTHPSSIKQLFASNYKLTDYASKNLEAFLKEHGELLVSEALKRAICNEIDKPIAYIKVILEKWASSGVQTLEDIERYEKNFRNQKRSYKKQKPNKKKTANKQYVPSCLKEELNQQNQNNPNPYQNLSNEEQQALIQAKLRQMREAGGRNVSATP